MNDDAHVTDGYHRRKLFRSGSQIAVRPVAEGGGA